MIKLHACCYKILNINYIHYSRIIYFVHTWTYSCPFLDNSVIL